MSIRHFRLALSVAVVAGCSTGRLPNTSFAQSGALERAMRSYYEAHASEDHGYCSSPYIDGLSQVHVVDEQPQRLVVDVRYFYRDWQKSNRGDSNGGNECTGFAGRSFTFGKDAADGVKILEMTGPRRS